MVNPIYVILFVFGMTVSFYLLGFTPAAFQLGDYQTLDAQTVLGNIMSYLFSVNGFLTTGVLVGFFALAIISGQNLWAGLVVAMGIFVFQFMIFPSIPPESMPAELGIIVNAFFAIAMVVALIVFIRGG